MDKNQGWMKQLLILIIGLALAYGIYYVSNGHNGSLTHHPNAEKSSSTNANSESVNIISGRESK